MNHLGHCSAIQLIRKRFNRYDFIPSNVLVFKNNSVGMKTQCPTSDDETHARLDDENVLINLN